MSVSLKLNFFYLKRAKLSILAAASMMCMSAEALLAQTPAVLGPASPHNEAMNKTGIDPLGQISNFFSYGTSGRGGEADASVPTRPFRIGVLRLNPGLDRQKPLALSDLPGWVTAGGYLVGGFDERWVGALSPIDGQVAWWYDGETDLTMPPGVFGSWVMVGFRNGKIAKLDATNGKRIWDASLDSFVERHVVLSGTTLLVLTTGQVLYAIDFLTGKTLWLYDGGFPDSLTIRGAVPPLVHDNKVIIGLASGEILAVNLQTGKLLWRYNPVYSDARFHDIVGEMVMRGGQLLVSRYDGLVAAIDITGTDRKVVWQEQLPSLTVSAFRNGRYYVGQVNGDLVAFDAVSGHKVWNSAVQTGPTIGSILPGENIVYTIGSNGRVTAVEAATGKIAFHDDVGGEVQSAPVVTGNIFMVATSLKNLYAFRLY